MTPSTMLQATSLSRRFGGLVVLDDVHVELLQGECLGLVGGNGAGKTSLLNLLSGADRLGQGQLLFAADGAHLTNISSWTAWQRARCGIFHYFQQPHLWRNLTVREHVLIAVTESRLEGSIFGTIRWCLSSQARRGAGVHVDETLDIVGLRDRAGDRISELSFGQQKLVSLARLLAAPVRRLLLLDEPTAGIAPELVNQMMSIFRRLKEANISMVIVEHDTTMLSSLADRVVELRNGRFVSPSGVH